MLLRISGRRCCRCRRHDVGGGGRGDGSGGLKLEQKEAETHQNSQNSHVEADDTGKINKVF